MKQRQEEVLHVPASARCNETAMPLFAGIQFEKKNKKKKKKNSFNHPTSRTMQYEKKKSEVSK